MSVLVTVNERECVWQHPVLFPAWGAGCCDLVHWALVGWGSVSVKVSGGQTGSSTWPRGHVTLMHWLLWALQVLWFRNAGMNPKVSCSQAGVDQKYVWLSYWVALLVSWYTCILGSLLNNSSALNLLTLSQWLEKLDTFILCFSFFAICNLYGNLSDLLI